MRRPKRKPLPTVRYFCVECGRSVTKPLPLSTDLRQPGLPGWRLCDRCRERSQTPLFPQFRDTNGHDTKE